MTSFRKTAVLLVLTLALAMGPAVYAFCDIQDDPGEQAIRTLEQQGIIKGTGFNRFEPSASLTFAQGVALVVRAFDLQVPASPRPEPDASILPPSSGHPEDAPPLTDAWYSGEWQTALSIGLLAPDSATPDQTLTRGGFARLLYQGMELSGDYSFVNQYILIGDAERISPDAMTGIQTLLLARIAELNSDMSFRPEESISRSTAAVWVLRSLEYTRLP